MKGTMAYGNRYEKLARNRIEKIDERYMLKGFYNYIITTKSYSSAYLYLSYVINFLKDVSDVTKIDIDDYNGYLASLKSKSQTAQIDAYHALQKYSRYLKAKGVNEDHMIYVDRPKFFETAETKEKREKGYLTKTEAKKIVKEALTWDTYKKDADKWNYRDYVILTIFLTTGIRCSALYKIDVRDVDLDECAITVFEKGNKARKIYISEETCEAIKKWLEIRSELLDGTKEDALIISNRKKRLESQSIACVIKRIGYKVTGRMITPHKLRATYGTQLYAKTRDLYFVQECMGHSNPKTTELYIRGQKKDASKKAADLMNGFMN